jgi:hypothetical protein
MHKCECQVVDTHGDLSLFNTLTSHKINAHRLGDTKNIEYVDCQKKTKKPKMLVENYNILCELVVVLT